MLDLLIKNGTVVDGTGSPEYQADIGIKGEMISQIASKIGEPAKETIDAGGYIWHTTGSGKTLTSFKTAQLCTQLDYVDKVLSYGQ